MIFSRASCKARRRSGAGYRASTGYLRLARVIFIGNFPSVPSDGRGVPGWLRSAGVSAGEFSTSSIKRDVKKKPLPRPEAEKILVSRSSPLTVSALDCRSRGLALACLPFPWVSSSGGDHANRVLKLGKRTWYLSVNHGSIGGSWPIAISGYPRRHNV